MNGVSLFFAGDFCSKPSTSNIVVEKELKELVCKSDVSVVNFEVPLRPHDISNFPRVGYERFFQNDDSPEFLKIMGFDLFSVANNHLFDWGEDGYKKTSYQTSLSVLE